MAFDDLDFNDPAARLAHLTDLEKLSETLSDRNGGELFKNELEEARLLADTDARFTGLVEGLSASSLGERLGAINRFFDDFGTVELAALELPVHLGQLRAIYLSSR
ncbi:MAG TPA: hypothetical protein QGG47_08720 [Acidobacteriota bacterium]|nr:hypothetical protein [Acidobacteriota bacterium]